MEASLSHIQINVSDREKSFLFYKDFLGCLGYRFTHEDERYFGMTNGTTDVWIEAVELKYQSRSFHRKGPGLNHVAFRVASREDVDMFCAEFLKPRGIVPLYGSPRQFPEYSKNYYAVYFEDPDRIKLEVASF